MNTFEEMNDSGSISSKQAVNCIFIHKAALEKQIHSSIIKTKVKSLELNPLVHEEEKKDSQMVKKHQSSQFLNSGLGFQRQKLEDETSKYRVLLANDQTMQMYIL